MHKTLAKSGNTHFYNSIKKYGVESFILETLEECGEGVLSEREIYYINHFDTFKNGYNMTLGGDGGDTSHSLNYKNGMATRCVKGKNNPMYGKVSAMKGKKHTEDAKKKQSAARQKHWENITETDLKKMSKKVSGKNNGMYGKTPSNAMKIKYKGKIYNSLAAASREVGVSVKFLKREGEIINEL
jgi:group I intron endonuclease